MRLKELELTGFKSFAKKTSFLFEAPITAIVGPNGSGKSNAAEAFRWVLGERSMKSLRGKRGEDLIFNGGQSSPRANQASATLVFDNQDHLLPIDYDEVAITRRIFRDGTNEYAINSNPVRYREMVELLAGASLGISDHFIINQGEADRILSANERERRTMVEDALGLRIYQWKIEDSERKLKQTKENMDQVASLRRELAPHIKFLKKQMERIEEAGRLKTELGGLYRDYLTVEAVYLETERAEVNEATAVPRRELERLEAALRAYTATATVDQVVNREKKEIIAIEARLRDEARRRDEVVRQLGRLEAVLEVRGATQAGSETAPVPWHEVEKFTNELENLVEHSNGVNEIFTLKTVLSKIRALVVTFLGTFSRRQSERPSGALDVTSTREEKAALELKLEQITKAEIEARARLSELNAQAAKAVAAINAEEREYLERKSELNAHKAELATLTAREEKLRLEETHFKEERAEARVLLGYDPLKDFSLHDAPAHEGRSRAKQEEARKRLERLKIKLEDLGLDSSDTVKEYGDITSRDEFLAKELGDLEQSAKQLQTVMAELRLKIDREFANGVKKINEHFQEFFALMFGGGLASLALVHLDSQTNDEESDALPVELRAPQPEEEGDRATGIDIRVNLPRKKIKGLAMLSGGERALVSIALLFAMSQVNPPPFLILDETDAALDEANSRKYSAMVTSLAKHSQLILITHNRETMSNAGVIYGVTMGADGISKLLSIKFDEAVGYAK